MRIMVYNILDGGIGRIDPIAEIIRQADPDCIILPEASDRPGLEKLARRLSMDHFLAQSPARPTDAVGLLSRLTIRQATNLAPLDHRFTRAALSALLQNGPIQWGLIGIHLHARQTLADEAVRLTEIPALLAAAAPWRAANIPHLLAGDFNASSPDQPIDLAKLPPKARQRIAGQHDLIPRQAISAILHAGYIDTHTLHRPPADFGCSFTTSHPSLRVDYIFIPAPLQSLIRSSIILTPPLATYASDHYPILCELADGLPAA